MKRIFISQVMNGKTEEEILQERKSAIEVITKLYGGEVVYFIDSFITGAKDVNPLFCLGYSLQSLSKADESWFVDKWYISRGCRIEHTCCKDYDIPCHYLNHKMEEVDFEEC